ncbi:MAG: response regulator transcription factor [Salinivirgaceae bacterium]|jgi:two-component system alkaline phosphatase synthesis response regulator PhoP|nr:response regulator transcription factor [Salinivirgaceae bacterium]
MAELKNQKILLVDDEQDILEFVSYNLTKEGYTVSTASNGKEAIQKAMETKPHLILLDVMMPEMDGIETCFNIREIDELNSTIIAFLTARNEDYSQIAGFEAGGDDYIAKPIKPKVLISRVKALLKRYRNHSEEPLDNESHLIQIGDLVIDKEKYIIVYKGQELILPRKEFELLALLASKKNKVFTRDEIYAAVWGDNIIVGDRTIDVHIRKVREKIGNELIKTIKGVGYKFVDIDE